MMTKMTLTACLLWGACALSFAAPANAYAITMQAGAYATCSNSYEAAAGSAFCYHVEAGYFFYPAYRQQIRFVDTGCSSGGTCAQNGDVWTEQLYSTGRKPATLMMSDCDGVYNVYGLDSCSC
jgi:hypothetical protein